MGLLVEGRLALVTGGSSGIGRATCQALAREGATVIATCIDEKGVAETANTLSGSGHLAMKYDVTDFEGATDVLKKIIQIYKKPPCILINCAGICPFTSALDETPESIQRVLDVNLKGTFFTCQAICRELVACCRPGSIVNIASMTGHKGFDGMSAYTASKHAVEAVTRCLARDMSRNNIRVNSVQPGMIETPMSAGCPQEMVDSWLSQLATRRKGQPSEVAEVIVFLASDRASYVNGVHVPVTGGY